MTTLDQAISTPAASSGLFARVYRAVVNWNAARETRDQLMKLSDNELKDIGLTRDQIHSAIRSLYR